ncbi:MAG: 50S ribosomal protein L29 [Deltaproteobacteria bacterium]|nr:50S ribosomal protein L29 [Deltaproteobacteria bacterium]NIS77016.1 50S ribosomal protein L29 [Deltaproteobacteria bacterium]
MKAKEMRDLTLEELTQKEAELEDEIFRLKIKRFTTELENKMLIRSKRRVLARMKTVIKEKQVEIDNISEEVSE